MQTYRGVDFGEHSVDKIGPALGFCRARSFCRRPVIYMVSFTMLSVGWAFQCDARSVVPTLGMRRVEEGLTAVS